MDSGLGRRIQRIARERIECHGRGSHDKMIPLGKESVEFLYGIDWRENIGLKDLFHSLPILLLDLFVVGKTCIGYKDIDCLELIHRKRNQMIDFSLFGYVHN